MIDLAEIKKRLRPGSVLALTVAPGGIAGVLVRRDSAAGFGAPSFTLPAGSEEMLKNPENVGGELLLALGGAGIRERRCVVCLPPAWALTASTDLPEVGAEDLRGYLELRAEREFSIPLSDLRFAYSSYLLAEGKRRATLAVIPAKRVEALEKMLAAAGCRALSISLALEGAHSGEAPLLHLVAADSVDVVLTGGGGVMGLRSLPGPGTAGETPFNAESFCREIRITLGRMPEAMRRQGLRARFGGEPAAAQALCLLVTERLGQMGIECPECDRAGRKASPGGAAAEAAERFLREQASPFEFVIPETNRFEEMFQRFDSQGRRKIAAVVAGAFLLLILTVLIRSHMESSLTREWDGMKQNVAELDAIQQKIRFFRPWFETSPQGVQVLESLVSAFPDGGDAWAKSIQIGEGYKITCTIFARNESAWMALLDRLRVRPDVTALQVQQLRGGNPVQFSVTYKWKPAHEG